MPRLNVSQTVRDRISTILTALMEAANGARDVPSSCTIHWATDASPSLFVEGQFQDLIWLIYREESDATLKERLRNDVRVLEVAGVLQDIRQRRQGSKFWRFSLALWSKTNLQQNQQEVMAAIDGIRG